MAYLVDNPPARRQYRSPRRQKPSGVCVVHTAESTPDQLGADAGAENVAAFIRRRSDPGSYHDLCDSDTIVQLVRYSDEAFHDGTGSNPHSYGVSAATQAARWDQLDDDYAESMVRNMARAAARYATWIKTEHNVVIPAKRITRAESEARWPGFLSHAERDPARRTDPGKSFPWDLFLDTYAALLGGQTPEDDDMATPREMWSYENTGIENDDAYGLLVRAARAAEAAARDAAYATKQNKSIAGAVVKLATGSNDITPAELKAVQDAAAGK